MGVLSICAIMRLASDEVAEWQKCQMPAFEQNAQRRTSSRDHLSLLLRSCRAYLTLLGE